MAGAGIRALAGEKPMSNKALSAHVTARGEQAEMLARAPHPSMMAGLREHLAKHFPEAGKGGTAAKLVADPASASPVAGPRSPRVSKLHEMSDANVGISVKMTTKVQGLIASGKLSAADVMAGAKGGTGHHGDTHKTRRFDIKIDGEKHQMSARSVKVGDGHQVVVSSIGAKKAAVNAVAPRAPEIVMNSSRRNTGPGFEHITARKDRAAARSERLKGAEIRSMQKANDIQDKIRDVGRGAATRPSAKVAKAAAIAELTAKHNAVTEKYERLGATRKASVDVERRYDRTRREAPDAINHPTWGHTTAARAASYDKDHAERQIRQAEYNATRAAAAAPKPAPAPRRARESKLRALQVEGGPGTSFGNPMRNVTVHRGGKDLPVAMTPRVREMIGHGKVTPRDVALGIHNAKPRAGDAEGTHRFAVNNGKTKTEFTARTVKQGDGTTILAVSAKSLQKLPNVSAKKMKAMREDTSEKRGKQIIAAHAQRKASSDRWSDLANSHRVRAEALAKGANPADHAKSAALMARSKMASERFKTSLSATNRRTRTMNGRNGVTNPAVAAFRRADADRASDARSAKVARARAAGASASP